VICLSLIALGEDVGCDMILRSFDHFLQYGEVSVKRAVSLSAALLNVSNPKVAVVDLLGKLCYDSNKEVAQNALFSLGLVAAGTNNSRIATTLRQLAAYYCEDTNLMMIIRIAQGLLHMGKGLLTINPIHSNNFLLSPVALAGVLTTILSFTENALILGKYPYLVYSLALSINPRMVMVVDEGLQPLTNVQLTVGTAVDTAGQAGNPRTITGFQVHNAPVLLSIGER
jgi:26S proteasome regulatory subunit N1